MRFGQFALLSTIVVALALPASAVARTHRRTTASHRTVAKHTRTRVQSQRTIDDERATQIQEALIKTGYLSGTPSGHWDSDSIAAMTKLQADNGWQTKLVPDSRALIKLGLGPSTDSAANLSPAPVAPSADSASSSSASLGPTSSTFAEDR